LGQQVPEDTAEILPAQSRVVAPNTMPDHDRLSANQRLGAWSACSRHARHNDVQHKGGGEEHLTASAAQFLGLDLTRKLLCRLPTLETVNGSASHGLDVTGRACRWRPWSHCRYERESLCATSPAMPWLGVAFDKPQDSVGCGRLMLRCLNPRPLQVGAAK
jgi:hypothetical protein